MRQIVIPSFSGVMRARGLAVAGCVLLAGLTGCGEPEVLLPGERFALRDFDAANEARAAEEDGQPLAAAVRPPEEVPLASYAVTGAPARLSPGGQRANSGWTHVNGTPAHAIQHPALAPSLTQVWTAPVGNASTRRVRIATDPVVEGGRIFTLDSGALLRAHSTGGGLLWERSLVPAGDNAGEAAGGGLAVAGNTIYVASGFGRLHAIDVTSGGTRWIQRLGAKPSGAPTISGGYVYLSTRDSQGWAIDAETGRILWQINGGDAAAVVDNGASPAVSSKSVLFPFGSGEVIAVLRRGGLQLWSTTLSGGRDGRAYASAVRDVASDPVVSGNRVYVGTSSGRLAALDLASGDRIWTATEGAQSPVWPAGGSVFLISDEARLLRLNAATGEEIWAASLPLFTETKVRRRRGTFAHYGPVLAGGRLIVPSTDGLLREISPESGALLRATQLGAPAASNPVVAGRTLYLVTADGLLRAFR